MKRSSTGERMQEIHDAVRAKSSRPGLEVPLKDSKVPAAGREEIPAEFTGMAGKYGATRARTAIALSNKAAGIEMKDLEFQKRHPEEIGEKAREQLVATAEYLKLDASQREVAEGLQEVFRKELEARGDRYLKEHAKYHRETVEAMLIADARKRGEISEDACRSFVIAASQPYLDGEISTLGMTGLISMKFGYADDSFKGCPETSAKFAAILNDEQRERYLEMQRLIRDFEHVDLDLKGASLDETASWLDMMSKFTDVYVDGE